MSTNRAAHTGEALAPRVSLPALLLSLLAFAGFAMTARGQVQLQLRRDPGISSLKNRPALLARDAPTENLLKRAGEAIQRQDWKLAIDSLQRVLDNPSAGLLAEEPDSSSPRQREGFVRYQSARVRATELLAGMPPEGLEAYRVLHDGRAKALFTRGREACDERVLREVVERYLLSRYGDDAAELLAGWELDRFEPLAALELLDQVDRWVPDSDVPRHRMAFKRAAAWLMLGERERAGEALSRVSNADAGAGGGGAGSQELSRMSRLVTEGWQSTAQEDLSPWPVGEESWPVAGGDLSRQRRMPAVSPELREDLPLSWRVLLPSEDPDWWETHFTRLGLDQRGVPVAMPVVSDGRVFVKSLSHVVALDLESLDPLWRVDPPDERFAPQRVQSRRLGWPQVQVGPEEQFSDLERRLYDYVGGTLSVAFGKVYSIERKGMGAAGKQTLGNLDRFPAQSGSYEGSRLIAHDVESGEIAWQRGRTGLDTDPLGSVNFLSLPIPVRGELWVVYADSADIHLAALSPEDGALLRKLLLCSVDVTQLKDLLHEAIYPASDGSTVYVTAGLGLVLAVDVERFVLRWVTQYPRSRQEEGTLEPSNWFCGPPMTAGALLLAAPPDCDQLMAMDRRTGEVRWLFDRPETAQYPLAGDGDRVWLGGEHVFCLSTKDGALLWGPGDRPRMAVTGRGVLSGPRILMPTTEGLAVLDAETGESLPSQPLPSDQLPLGNLLCLGSALFSVDTNEVRKFPDLTVAYPRELARHEADKGDEKSAIRLAWMELLRGEHERAFQVLESVRPTPSTAPRLVGDISRLRVDALLGMAEKPGTDIERSLGYLREACKLASMDRDRLRATLALAVKLREAGRGTDAYLSLWRLGLTAAGDGYVTVEPKLRNKARRVIGEVLSRFERDLTARQLAEIAAETRAAVADAIEEMHASDGYGTGLSSLKHLAELNDAAGGGQAALIAMARWELDQQRFERSEQFFLEAIRQDRVARMTAEALRDLAEQYLRPEQRLPLSAAKLLARLEREFSGLSLPAVEGNAEPVGVVEEVARLRSLIGRDDLAPGAFVEHAHRFKLIDEPVQGVSRDETPLVLFDYVPEKSEPSGRYILMHGPSSEVHALDYSDTSPAWKTQLRLLGARVERFDGPDPRAEISSDPYPRAFLGGQTAVINGPDGLFAVGLLTGRRLWGITYEDAETADRFALRNRLVTVSDNRLVCAPRRGVLACAPLVDGSDLAWERVLSGEKLDTVFIKDDYCVTVDNGWQRATVYDVTNGRLLSQIEFRQSEDDREAIPLAYVGGHLIGPDGGDGIACHSVLTGERSWWRPMVDELRWIFKPGDGYVGATGFGGRVVLVDVLSGETVMDVVVPEAAEGYAEGVLHGDALLLMPTTRTSRGDNPSLVSLDMESGRQKWSVENLGATGADRSALWKLLTLADDVMPVFYRQAIEAENPFDRQMGIIGVKVLNKATGAQVGPAISTGQAPSDAERLTGDFGIWPGRFLIGTRKAILSLQITGELDEDVHRRIEQGELP